MGGHQAVTRLDKVIKRELELAGKVYTVTISPQGIKIVPKGGRKGHETSWESLLSGEAELRRDLSMSLEMFGTLRSTGKDGT
jgi:hypothetical protein